MTRTRRLTPLSAALVTAVAGGSLAFFSTFGFVSERVIVSCLTLLLLTYLMAEAARVRRARPGQWLLDPAVVASVMTFGLVFVIGNIVLFVPAETTETVGLIPEVTSAMVKLMWLVLLGAIGMWIGYRLPIASGVASAGVQRAVGRWFSRSGQPRKMAIAYLVIAGAAARLLQIKLGVFGYSSSYDQLIAMGGITQYLGLASQLGMLALVVASLDFFSARHQLQARKSKVIFILLLELAFGVLSGFKSQIVMPFIVVGACNYLCTRSLPKIWIAWFLAALVLAYAVVQPFRDAKNASGSFDGTSIEQIVDMLLVSRENSEISNDAAPTWFSFMARSSLVHVGSMGVAYKDSVERLPEGSPRFLANLILAPAYAVVPRLIWKSKPSGDLGLWYTRVVMGRSTYSSTAMGPVTYLYFGGGALAVFLGFLGFGVLQKALLLLIQPWEGGARGFVFLALLPGITSINSAVDGTIVNLVRTIPLLMLVQYFVYRRGRARIGSRGGE